MKRTTVMLPDETLARLRQESRLRGSSVAEIVRTAVERHLAEPDQPQRRRLAFFAVANDGPADLAERADDYLLKALRRDERNHDEHDAGS